MTRPATVRFLRTDPTMAYPRGRLLAEFSGRYHVLATDGWVRIGSRRPTGSAWLSREEARKLCADVGLDPHSLDTVPTDDA